MEIRVEQLNKSYGGQTVLRDLSFTAGPGLTAVMAPSGAGKTTLLRILLGLEQADSGCVIGTDCRWSAVFQEPRLLEQLDAMGNLRFAAGRAFDREEACRLLEELNLAGEGEKCVREYSGGMKRRLALARALLVPFDALALDEPFAGLDADNRARALCCLKERIGDRPALMVTHDASDTDGLPVIRLG